MSSSRYFSSLYLITVALFLPTVLCADPLSYSCSNSDQNFTAGDPYDSNLKWLTSYLSSSTPLTGFGLGSLGRPTQYQTYGLALCRGDMSTEDCKACTNKAKDDIRNLCPNNKAAIVWYDHCLLKYSNEDFFGRIDYTNRFSLVNVNKVSDPVAFNQKVKDLLTRLSEKASGTPRMYAAGEMARRDQSYETLYGMAQCTRDLSSGDCKKCLVDAIGALPTCCDGKQGGRVVGGSCTIMYEVYPFVKVNA